MVVAREGREVTDDRERLVRVFTLAQKRDRALLRIVAIDPGETCWIAVVFVQRWLAPVAGVEVAHPALQAAVRGILQQMPVEAPFVAPLPLLSDFAPHEQQLLAGLHVHIAKEQPEIRPSLPRVTGHLAQEGALPVHHLVVRKRQHETFVEHV
jgi:hypothetical protein